MAIRRINGTFHIYFRDLDGHQRTRSLYTADEKIAIARERSFMSQLRGARMSFKASRLLQIPQIPHVQIPQIPHVQIPQIPHVQIPQIPQCWSAPPLQMQGAGTATAGAGAAGAGACACTFGMRRYSLQEIPAIAQKRRDFNIDHIHAWRRFAASCGCEYADEVTPKIAQNFLDSQFGNLAPKTFNNIRGCLSAIWRNAMVDCGITRNPFEQIPQKSLRNGVRHYRAFSDAEVSKLLCECAGVSRYWHCLVMIALNTGLRLESCKRLAPAMITDGVAEIMPGKTARFGRAVRIPLATELRDYLDAIPRGNRSPAIPYCECHEAVYYYPGTGRGSRKFFDELLTRCGIVRSATQMVGFPSLRDTFVTRMRSAGMDETALRGIVGHVSSDQTDLYSADTEMARREMSRIGGVRSDSADSADAK